MSDPKFRDSVAWKKAMELTAAVYNTTASFPREEMFGITNQLRQASVSIASNLAEGQGRLTIREFPHFLGVARGSTLEVQTQLEIARIIGIGNRDQIEKAQCLAEDGRQIINAAIKTTRANLQTPRPPDAG